MTRFKHLQKTLLFVLCMLFVLIGLSINVNAEKEVTSVEGGAAEYYVDSIIEEKELDFGVKYHNDFSYSRINDASYSVAAAYNAGGSANSSGPLEYGTYYTQNVNVLEIPKDSGVNIVAYANIKLGAWTLTAVKASIARYEEAHPDEKVIAAINGDYFDINSEKNYPRTSTGGTVSNGNYYKVNSGWKSIGFKNDADGLSMKGNILPTVSSHAFLEILDENENVIYSKEVDKINEKAEGSEVSAYFPMYNANHAVIKNDLTDIILITGDEIAPFSTSSVYGKGHVKEMSTSCSLLSNQFALDTKNSEVLSKIKVGSFVRVQFHYEGELEGYDNVIGYPNNLLVDGSVVKDPNYRHPRTMIGTRADGTIIMTTVDGRRTSKGYYGMAPIEQSALMAHYGCTDAYNLDGGGSTTMVILEDGEFVIKNEPSDNSPRNDGNCLLITVNVPRADISFENVKENSLTVNVEVEENDLYKEFYLKVNDELKKIENGKVSFDSLTRNTAYVYKLYTKLNGKMLGLPITGTINTAKEKLEITSAKTEIVTVKGEECVNITINLKDDDKTYVNMILEVDGKKYYASGNVFTVPLEKLSNINTYLSITYDLNDKTGRVTVKLKDFNANFSSLEMAIISIANDTDTWFNSLLNE